MPHSLAALLLAAAPVVWNFIEPVVVPAPQHAVWQTNTCVRLAQTKVVLESCGRDTDEAKVWFAAAWKRAFGQEADLITTEMVGSHQTPCAAEHYTLEATSDKIRIHAASLAGFRHAFHTLRQIVIADRVGMTRQGWILPACKISDEPSLAFRGLHLCWFPEQTVRDIERTIRLAAYYKFNYVVLENWGVWRSERHPWFGWADGKMTAAEVKRLVRVAADEGVTLVPHFNVFGHASLSRVRTGNHATLDIAPEYEPLFEPYSGWNWCLSNPDARRTIRDIARELHDLFGRPPFFHIGCDEACPPTCPKCRAADYNDLFASLVHELADDLRAHGASLLMWHDMLIARNDTRFNTFYCNGTAHAEALLDSLPKDVVICDWFYGPAREAYPTLDYFREKGLRVLTCPKNDPSGIAAQGKVARTRGLFGFLGTTWADMYGRQYPEVMLSSAAAAWGVPRAPVWLHQDMTSPCNYHLRQVNFDIGTPTRRETGFDKEQMPSASITR